MHKGAAWSFAYPSQGRGPAPQARVGQGVQGAARGLRCRSGVSAPGSAAALIGLRLYGMPVGGDVVAGLKTGAACTGTSLWGLYRRVDNGGNRPRLLLRPAYRHSRACLVHGSWGSPTRTLVAVQLPRCLRMAGGGCGACSGSDTDSMANGCQSFGISFFFFVSDSASHSANRGARSVYSHSSQAPSCGSCRKARPIVVARAPPMCSRP